MLAVYDDVMAIILPTLGEERRETYSPFLPVWQAHRPGVAGADDSPQCRGRYRDPTVIPETGEEIETGVTGGQVKCQWKADWALRWYALGVDYEMAGKDLIDSVNLSSKICRALGRPAPEGFNYELFLDENGQKISKSRGNGLTIDEWLTYASEESLSLYMYQKPKTAKKLYFDVIPKAVDEYFSFLSAYQRQDWKNRLGNPVWHMHDGNPPDIDNPVPFAMLLNLVSASNAENSDVLWGLHLALRAWRHATESSKAQRAGRLRDPLFQGFCRTDQGLPACRRGGAAGTRRTGRKAGRAAAGCRWRSHPGCGARCCQGH